MKTLNLVATLMLSMLMFTAVAMAATVKYDYDRDIDFSKWANAAWAGPQAADASMIEKRLEKAIENGFRDRGYAFVTDRAQAEFLVAYEAGAWQDRSLNGTGGPLIGRSMYVRRENRGALVVRVYERATGELAWHGVVADALAGDPDQADKRTAKAVAALLKKFPARGGDR